MDGFTLVEILASLSILAVLASLVVPIIGDGRARAVTDAAERFAMLLNQAREEVVLTGRWWRLDIDAPAALYRFAERVDGRFVPVMLAPFTGDHVVVGVELREMVVNGEPAADMGGIVLLPSGEQDSLRLVFASGPFRRRVAVPPMGPARVEPAQQ